MELERIVKLFCDGSSKLYDNKVRIGSYALLVVEYNPSSNDHTKLYENAEANFDWTNNIAELNGLIAAFEYIKNRIDRNKMKFVIFSDSEYAIKSTLYYVKKWNRNGYKLISGLPVKNDELMKKIFQLYYVDLSNVDITIQWIKSHQNSKQVNALYNNIVDLKAKQAKDLFKDKYKEEFHKRITS